MSSPLHFLRTTRFLPLFVTQFLGAFNDNLFKNAVVILVTFTLAERMGADAGVLVAAAAGVFILPFFLFSASAGQLADQREKSRLIRRIKLIEIPIMGLATLGFWLGNGWMLLATLFLMGTQSTFFGPLKYGILPDHLHEDELIGGNAWIETGTFIAILLGSIIGGVVIASEGGAQAIGWMLLTVAALGFAASRFIPAAEPQRGGGAAPIDWHVPRATGAILKQALSERALRLSILGISWFWLVGAAFLSLFPLIGKELLGATAGVVTLFLTLFSVGIGIGSMLCNKLLAGRVDARYVPVGALGITLFAADLYLALSGVTPSSAESLGVGAFLSTFLGWRVSVDLMGLAVSGGLFIVPLYALLQTRSEEGERSQTIAANNIVNAGFMVVSALAVMALRGFGVGLPEIVLSIGLINLIVAIYVVGLLPDVVLKRLLQGVLRLLYRVEVSGVEHFAAAGERVVIVVNHLSFLDPVLLAAFLPERPLFAVNSGIAKRWWVRPFLHLVEAYPVDPADPFSIRAMARRVGEGNRLAIFPEGRITVTGALMKVYEGPGVIADRADATLLPIQLEGAQYTHFSRIRDKIKPRLFPHIRMTILPPRRMQVPAEIKGRGRRKRIGAALYDLMCEMQVRSGNDARTLTDALADAWRIHGDERPILEDITRKPVTYARVMVGAQALGRPLAAFTQPEEAVGLLLPNSVATVSTFFGLSVTGRIPAMLNFSAGPASIASAARTACLKSVVTSCKFIAAGKLEPVIEALQADGRRIVYLEEIAANIGRVDKLRALAAAWRRRLARPARKRADEAAVILFTSGSEGAPKGVVLSHRNLLANCQQLSARLDYDATDRIFNALPVFHSFGLTGGLLLPLLSGVRGFLYPSPLHYRVIPELVYDTNSTILFGTDTFLAGYARVANAYDFYSLRRVFAGAEKVRQSTRDAWFEQFGLRILEGYGATETSPALSANTAMHCRIGTVGRLLPGITYRLEPVPGIDTGGRLVVRGPNVMKGYLKADNPGVLQPPADGEYDTGDIVSIDEDGFVTIQGRAKRFAKIAGEMISLGAVEEAVGRVWPGVPHAVVNLPDARKGEKLVLVTEQEGAHTAALRQAFQVDGLPELALPREMIVVKSMPLLGTGKLNHPAIKQLAVEAGY
ncbi:acyl-[ACP]--phospholipid O-acyltransferase [Magnetofaba australis]|uniref:Putative acylglycerophosphoethanolamine acyltransferase n=1 Tax=Magnetofaba australis IT-1 TaxID=1434232 RepID=A0A1Y2K0V3_9PROT|nr:acyl-[ACP]--phospholipid O-acyltransferase [Magnetofaba australis]OSM01579.1 putative acylglycerophosphoethanolamine acyltransferase [Magnetofaba australis IT-1]